MPRLNAATAWQGSPIVIYDLVEGLDGINITQASVSSLTARAFLDSSGEAVGPEITLTISDCIFDTVQLEADDPRYEGDGFNFRATIPGSFFAPGSDDYLVTVFIYFYDQSTPPILSVIGWQITAKQVLGLPAWH